MRHAADAALQNQLFDSATRRRVTVVEGDDDLAIVLGLGFQDRLGVGRRARHGLFTNHVQPAFEGGDDIPRVRMVGAGDDDGIGLCLVNHLLEFVFPVGGRAFTLGHIALADAESKRVLVQQTHKLRHVGEGLTDRSDVHIDGAVARTADSVLLHSMQLLTGGLQAAGLRTITSMLNSAGFARALDEKELRLLVVRAGVDSLTRDTKGRVSPATAIAVIRLAGM